MRSNNLVCFPPPTDYPVVCEHCERSILCIECGGDGRVLVAVRVDSGSGSAVRWTFVGPKKCSTCGGHGLDEGHECHRHLELPQPTANPHAPANHLGGYNPGTRSTTTVRRSS